MSEEDPYKAKYRNLKQMYNGLVHMYDTILEEKTNLVAEMAEKEKELAFLRKQNEQLKKAFAPKGTSDGLLESAKHPNVYILSSDSFKANIGRMLQRYNASKIVMRFKCASPMNVKQHIKKKHPGLFISYYLFDKSNVDTIVQIIKDNHGEAIE